MSLLLNSYWKTVSRLTKNWNHSTSMTQSNKQVTIDLPRKSSKSNKTKNRIINIKLSFKIINYQLGTYVMNGHYVGNLSPLIRHQLDLTDYYNKRLQDFWEKQPGFAASWLPNGEASGTGTFDDPSNLSKEDKQILEELMREICVAEQELLFLMRNRGEVLSKYLDMQYHDQLDPREDVNYGLDKNSDEWMD